MTERPPREELTVELVESRGRYSASIRNLCLVETGSDPVTVCKAAVERAHFLTDQFHVFHLYVPPR